MQTATDTSGFEAPVLSLIQERMAGRLGARILELWFRPKVLESERLYRRLGVLLIKRYVPTGGDIVMRHLRRYCHVRALVSRHPQSLLNCERGTRIAEAVHLVSFLAFSVLAIVNFRSRSLTSFGLTLAVGANLVFGLWPAFLQRYNRLRLRRAIRNSAEHTRGTDIVRDFGATRLSGASLVSPRSGKREVSSGFGA